MNYQTKSHYSDDVVAAWREQLAEAAENPWLAGLLLKYGERTLRRFVYFYEQLRTLSRRARRYIQRKMALSLSAAAFLLALSGMHVPVAYAAGINVTDGKVDVSENNVCSLIEAIENANDTTDGLVHDDCAAGDPAGADIINLPPGGLFNLTGAYPLGSDNGLPVISSNITIEGNGSTIERDSGAATPQFRIFAVDSDGELTLRDTTITGGDVDGDGGGILNYGKVAILNNSVISGNEASNAGGGVANDGGEVTIENSLVSGNRAYDDGGGVYNYEGTLTINNSVISGNEANEGGGVYNYEGQVTIESSTISSNDTHDDGGGVYNYGGAVTIVGSTISGNTARDGGGVYNYGGQLTIESSAISGNTARDGGGVYNYGGDVTINESDILGNTAHYSGGGVANYSGEVAIENSTISGNVAEQGDGGGVYNYEGAVTIQNSTILGNDARYDGGGVHNYMRTYYHEYFRDDYGVVTIENSTISGNDAQYGSGGGVANSLHVDGAIFANGKDASPLDSGSIVNHYGGAVVIRESTISGNDAHRDGGGVFNYVYHHLPDLSNNASRLEDDVTFTDYDYFGAVVIENSTISGNEAGEEKAIEIQFDGGDVKIQDNGSDNEGGRGGGVFNGFRWSYDQPIPDGCDCYYGEVIIKDSAISDNDALFGGGVFNGYRWSYDVNPKGVSPLQEEPLGYVYSIATIENSTISGNKAQAGVVGYDGDSYVYGGGDGGGVLNYYGMAIIDHSTVSGNEADGSEFRGKDGDFVGVGGLFDAFVGVGGGVFNFYGDVDILNDSAISGNIATGGHCYGDEEFDTHVINGGGGGLFNYYGLAFVTDSAISGNIVSGGYNENDYEYNLFVLTGGGGVLNAIEADGGGGRSAVSGNALSPLGVQNGEIHYWGKVVIENSAISGNVVSGRQTDGDVHLVTGGGGVLNYTYYAGNARGAASPQMQQYGSVVAINQSTISGNIVSGGQGDEVSLNGGGGVANYGGEVAIYNSTLSDNTAGYGGGVGNEHGWVGIDQSTISGNDAFVGGGVANDGGVGLYHSTISDNTANRYGGGVANDGLGNLGHTIVSGNTAVRGREVFGNANTYGYNLFGHDDDPGVYGFDPRNSSDIVPGIDVRVSDILDPLANNGGSTETHALVLGSKAINAGNPKIVDPDYDQRGSGFERVVNEVVDIGAYEYKGPPILAVGGFTSPAKGLEQLLPASGLLAAIVALATSGVALVKRRKD